MTLTGEERTILYHFGFLGSRTLKKEVSFSRSVEEGGCSEAELFVAMGKRYLHTLCSPQQKLLESILICFIALEGISILNSGQNARQSYTHFNVGSTLRIKIASYCDVCDRLCVTLCICCIVFHMYVVCRRTLN